MFKSVNRFTPHNCTECENFENIEFRSDSNPEITVPEDILLIDCKIKGKEYCNNSLWLCNNFNFDISKKSLVVRDTSYNSSHYRIFYRAKPDIPDLESTIYDYITKVWELDPRGYNFTIAVTRINKDLGISKETIFLSLNAMIESGYITKEKNCGIFYLKPPSMVSTIANIKGRFGGS